MILTRAEVYYEDDNCYFKFWFKQYASDDEENVREGPFPNKEVALARAQEVCEYRAEQQTESFELIIKNKDGSIGKGSGSKQTYNYDPPETEG